MEQFSGRSMAVGTINGLRAFDVDERGRLTGVTHKSVWRPGENVAKCPHPYTHRELAKDEAKKSGSRSSIPSRCSCGFYAFFNGDNIYASDFNITGVVEAYGEVVMGTHGFRAEKARIAGIVVPKDETSSPGAWTRMIHLLAKGHLGIFVLMPSILMTVLSFVFGVGVGVGGYFVPAVFAAIVFSIAVLGIVIGVQAEESWITDSYVTQKPYQYVDYERVMLNYKDIPVYPSVEKMLEAHPVTPPLASDPRQQTPDNTPDFWED